MENKLPNRIPSSGSVAPPHHAGNHILRCWRHFTMRKSYLVEEQSIDIMYCLLQGERHNSSRVEPLLIIHGCAGKHYTVIFSSIEKLNELRLDNLRCNEQNKRALPPEVILDDLTTTSQWISAVLRNTLRSLRDTRKQVLFYINTSYSGL